MARRPRQNARVLRFVPQSVLRIRRPASGGKCGEQTLLVVGIKPRRRRAAQVGKALAEAGPEILVSGRRHHGRSPVTLQSHVPKANESRRRSPSPITSIVQAASFPIHRHVHSASRSRGWTSPKRLRREGGPSAIARDRKSVV